jgi:pterin-4a-carbinolamine dehydratase
MNPNPQSSTATPSQAASPGRLKPERVQLEIANLPGWNLQPGGRAIVHHHPLSDTGQALAFLADLGALGRAQGRLPEVVLRATGATLRLPMPQAGWIASADYELARALCAPQ